MEHLRGAFKANYAPVVCEVKETGRLGHVAAPVRDSNDQNSCKKFSQIAMFAQKIDGLPPKHTFSRSKN
jgi:hypothetical protein